MHPNGQWHHWVVRTAPSGTQFFIDGQIVLDTNYFISNTSVLGTDLIIGSMINTNGIGVIIDGNNDTWKGKIDDIGIWNRALTYQEIQGLHFSDVWTNNGYHHFVFDRFYHQFLMRRRWDLGYSRTAQMLKEKCDCENKRVGKEKLSVFAVKEFDKKQEEYKQKVLKEESPY